MPKKLNQVDVVDRFISLHGDRYDYSKVHYINSAKKVKIICKEHGVFSIAPSHHFNGVGCKRCHFDSVKLSRSEFIERANATHNSMFDYSLVDMDPLGTQVFVEIKCKRHNSFFMQLVITHISGHNGCRECLSEKLSGVSEMKGCLQSRGEISQDFILRARKIHGEKYDYSKTSYYGTAIDVVITCPDHGDFKQRPQNHLRGNGCGKCAKENGRAGSFKKKCRDLGVDYFRALKRRQAGMPEDKIFRRDHVRSERKTTTAVTVFGIDYPNIEVAMGAINPPASSASILRWIKGGMSPDDAFRKIANPGYGDGIIYEIKQKTTGKIYIGLTVTNLAERWMHHLQQARRGAIKSEMSLHHAIRTCGEDDFVIEEIDRGVSKVDLEAKERFWIEERNSIAPSGFNLNTGGTSGGAERKKTEVDGKAFESVGAAALYIAETRGISISAAEKRYHSGRIDVKAPARKGESLVKTKEYRVWSTLMDQHRKGDDVEKDWVGDFKRWLNDVGSAPTSGHRFCRKDKRLGFTRENCKWMTPGEDGKTRVITRKSDVPGYKAWVSMKANARYPAENRRPIEIEEAWASDFYAWVGDVGEMPSSNHKFGRIDTRFGFIKGNCKWMTRDEYFASRGRVDGKFRSSED